jgi:hypothetical protein
LTIEPFKNIPIDFGQNIPLALSRQHLPRHSIRDQNKRRYNKSQTIETVAVNQYKKNGKGITYRDLLPTGIASNKTQAQVTLKHCLARKILFTLGNCKPQQYYPARLKSEILKKNIPIGVTGARYSKAGLLQSKSTTNNHGLEPVIDQSLVGYVLPLLPRAPLHIHKMQFKLRISPEYYHEIVLTADRWNKSKGHEEIIGQVHVRYCFYANGTVMVFTEGSNTPFKIEDEVDLSRLIAFECPRYHSE